MNWLRQMIGSVGLGLTVILSGCANQGTPRSDTDKPMERALSAMVLLDWTGSYGTKQLAMRQASDLLKRSARPGDCWTFRYIGPGSYADDCLLLTVRLPQLNSKPVDNPFDRAAREEREQEEAWLRGTVKKAADALLTTPVKNLRQTDIMGALAKAGESLAAVPKGTGRVLVCFTDLGETVFREAEINLQGVRVVFALTNDKSDVKKEQKLKAKWRSRLQKAGAEVVFYDPSMGSLGMVATGREDF